MGRSELGNENILKKPHLKKGIAAEGVLPTREEN